MLFCINDTRGDKVIHSPQLWMLIYNHIYNHFHYFVVYHLTGLENQCVLKMCALSEQSPSLPCVFAGYGATPCGAIIKLQDNQRVLLIVYVQVDLFLWLV